MCNQLMLISDLLCLIIFIQVYLFGAEDCMGLHIYLLHPSSGLRAS